MNSSTVAEKPEIERLVEKVENREKEAEAKLEKLESENVAQQKILEAKVNVAEKKVNLRIAEMAVAKLKWSHAPEGTDKEEYKNLLKDARELLKDARESLKKREEARDAEEEIVREEERMRREQTRDTEIVNEIAELEGKLADTSLDEKNRIILATKKKFLEYREISRIRGVKGKEPEPVRTITVVLLDYDDEGFSVMGYLQCPLKYEDLLSTARFERKLVPRSLYYFPLNNMSFWMSEHVSTYNFGELRIESQAALDEKVPYNSLDIVRIHVRFNRVDNASVESPPHVVAKNLFSVRNTLLDCVREKGEQSDAATSSGTGSAKSDEASLLRYFGDVIKGRDGASRCMVHGTGDFPTDAAHIVAKAQGSVFIKERTTIENPNEIVEGVFDVANGIMLCKKCHILLDQYYWYLSPEDRKTVVKSKELEMMLNMSSDDIPRKNELDTEVVQELENFLNNLKQMPDEMDVNEELPCNWPNSAVLQVAKKIYVEGSQKRLDSMMDKDGDKVLWLCHRCCKEFVGQKNHSSCSPDRGIATWCKLLVWLDEYPNNVF